MIENKKFLVNDEAWAHDLEKGVESYTDMLFEALWEGNEEVIPETQQDNNTDIATLGFIGGFIVMMMLDVALG
jgi:hypothetical protein